MRLDELETRTQARFTVDIGLLFRSFLPSFARTVLTSYHHSPHIHSPTTHNERQTHVQRTFISARAVLSDRRIQQKKKLAPRGFHSCPAPPLRAAHWEKSYHAFTQAKFGLFGTNIPRLRNLWQDVVNGCRAKGCSGSWKVSVGFWDPACWVLGRVSRRCGCGAKRGDSDGEDMVGLGVVGMCRLREMVGFVSEGRR